MSKIELKLTIAAQDYKRLVWALDDNEIGFHAEPLLQQTHCSKLLPSVQEMIDVIEAEKVKYPRMFTADVLRLLNRVKELAAIA